MKQRIRSTLNMIEDQENVKMIYACESGSRAWGFASQDSDFDVRFLYLRPPSWYLSIDLEHKRDVIELPIEDELDVNGWDFRKALQLFRKSNPPLMEWLGSPIVYYEHPTLVARMREMASLCYSPIACMYHYYKMAKGNHREFLNGDRVWLKKYLYVLRPILAVLWLERDMGIVPTQFEDLVEGVIESEQLREAINELLLEKQKGAELSFGKRIPAISRFLDQELTRMEKEGFDKKVKRCSTDELSALFRDALDELWPDG
jgi:predicted nucleotidyltransferase